MAEKAVGELMQYGATGILALAFLAVLVLWIRADKRNQGYYAKVSDLDFDRSQLMELVKQSTRASNTIATQLADMVAASRACREQSLTLHQRLDTAGWPSAVSPERK